MESSPVVVKDLVLLGGGHAHAFTLKNLGMNPIPGVRVTLISNNMDTPYSGMIPGFVAGHYTRDEVHLDLEKMARFAGARLVLAFACGLDREKKLVLLKGDHPPVPYDVLSIDIGSAPRIIKSPPPNVTAVKPIDSFCARWANILERFGDVERRSLFSAEKPMRFVTVGGGAGGAEVTLAMQFRLRGILQQHGHDPNSVHFTVVTKSNTVMHTHNRSVQRTYTRVLHDRGVEVAVNAEIVRVDEHGGASGGGVMHCSDADGRKFEFHEALWCTNAGAQAWLRETGLTLSAGGFIAVRDTLESENTPHVFAAGDVADMTNHPRPKAGVFAVRQGIPLTNNLRAALMGQPLQPFTPQTKFLSLVSTGDQAAVASWGPLCWYSAWLWRVKNHIDRTWMRKYKEFPVMPPPPVKRSAVAEAAGPEVCEVLSHAAMRCGGCGSKVGASVLSRVMARLDVPTRGEVLVGLDSPDDAAVVAAPPPGMVSVQTVDFFRSFMSDPYLFGQVAANHSLSDCYAMCAEPISALAVVVVPYGLEKQVEETLYQVMAGACKVLREANCALVGGHTAEGAELSLGFTINGIVDPKKMLRKGGMAKGQKLIITKPVGTGTLFAADMRGLARGSWISDAIKNMVQPNATAAHILLDHGATSCTDVTGFGVVGHLVEMLKASRASATLDLDALPVLAGARECVAYGVTSSLQPENLRLRRAVIDPEAAGQHPSYALTFDPQTSGGLLASVPADRAERAVQALQAAGYPASAVIGVVDQSGSVDATERVKMVFRPGAAPAPEEDETLARARAADANPPRRGGLRVVVEAAIWPETRAERSARYVIAAIAVVCLAWLAGRWLRLV